MLSSIFACKAVTKELLNNYGGEELWAFKLGTGETLLFKVCIYLHR